MKSSSELQRQLISLDRKGYPAYKSLAGQYAFGRYTLCIDHVQGDPFAAPSRLRIVMDQRVSGFPPELFDRPWKRTALEDHINRLFYNAIGRAGDRARGSGKSGLISVSRCGQEVLKRTAIDVDASGLTVRFEVGFPAAGRTILARELEKILFSILPEIAEQSLIYGNLNKKQVQACVDLADDQHAIRRELRARNLAAFIADGAILPRESGVSERPMRDGLPFRTPESLSVTLELPHRGRLTGMGIPCGITLIVGGGYHGKSTLLKALERGVYDHIAGDGREYVICDDTAVKIRAEDGRSICRTDISSFINNLPNGKNTEEFTTENASGSTSQAANMAEAVEAGSRLLLIDEDTSATNFMIRDDVMQKLITRDKEPITPFTDLIRPMHDQLGVSTILVVGSSGSYFRLADTVIQMDAYEPKDITEKVRRLCGELGLTADGSCAPAGGSSGVGGSSDADGSSGPSAASSAPGASAARPPLHIDCGRKLERGSVSQGDRGVKIKVAGRDSLIINKDVIDLRYVEQLVDPEQLMALGRILEFAEEHLAGRGLTLAQAADSIVEEISAKGLSALAGSHRFSGSLAMPRKQEIMACLNRFRRLRVRR